MSWCFIALYALFLVKGRGRCFFSGESRELWWVFGVFCSSIAQLPRSAGGAPVPTTNLRPLPDGERFLAVRARGAAPMGLGPCCRGPSRQKVDDQVFHDSGEEEAYPFAFFFFFLRSRLACGLSKRGFGAAHCWKGRKQSQRGAEAGFGPAHSSGSQPALLQVTR